MIETIQTAFSDALAKYNPNITDKPAFTAPPANISHFDIATNICMICIKKYNIKDTKEFLNFLTTELLKTDYFEDLEFINGFLNIKLSSKFLTSIIDKCLQDGDKYGETNIGNGKKVNLEFVSANPTGPLHIGHLRNAIVGESLCRVMKKCGFNVTKEYYINDAGEQIEVLMRSVYQRFKQIQSHSLEDGVEEGCYPGDYVIDIAKELNQDFDFESSDARNIIIEKVMRMIKHTLQKLGIYHDVFSSEKKLHNSGKMNELIDILNKQDLTYWGKIGKPKGKEIEDYEENSLLLFKSTHFGDEIDRPLKKSTGEWVYFASDGAYSLDKYQRGFEKLILLLGADHKGFVKRWTGISKAAIQHQDIELNCVLTELVNFQRNGEIVKMSKRKGNFLLIDDVLEEVSADILKFVLLMKKNNTVIDFDFEKVKEQSKENPVFYIQYASSRCNSVIRKIEPQNLSKSNDLHNELRPLIVKILFFSQMLHKVVQTMETNIICNYLLELSGLFHSIWHSEVELKNANIVTYKSLLAFQNTLKISLSLMNIEAMKEM